jgi:pimeloyl-ACP methyl ester carboxylesterase
MANLGRVVAAIIVLLTFTATAHAACPKGATCGRVTVPLDHSGATAGTLSIVYAKLPATGARAGTLVLLSGGPGQAALPLTSTFASLVKPLRASYDLVTVDQRGTGGSGAIDCPLETYTDVARCATALGPARPFLNTPETAKDLENVRQALGVDKLTLLGVSYGASVAADYVRRYPEHTAAVVLDSPTPVDGLDGVDQLRTFGTPRVLREVCYPGDCHATVPDPDEALVLAVEKLPLRGRQVLPSGRTRSVETTEDDLYEAISASDVTPGLRYALPAAIASAAKGDIAPLQHLGVLYGGSGSGGSDVNSARLLATSCIESLLPWSPDSPVASRADAVRRFIAERTAAFAPFKPATVLLGSLTNFCSTWPPTPKPEAVSYAGPDVPVLVLSGRQDLRTPLESARRTALQYPDAKLLAVPGAGHSVLSTDGSGCARTGLVAFLSGRPVAACPRPPKEFPAAPYAPAQLSSLRSTRLSGVPGQTVSAVTVTLTGVGYDSLAGSTRFPGLRAGYVQVRSGKLELHGVQWIKGVSVSGTIDSRGNGTLTVSGPVDGTVTYRNAKLTGTLGGQSF